MAIAHDKKIYKDFGGVIIYIEKQLKKWALIPLHEEIWTKSINENQNKSLYLRFPIIKVSKLSEKKEIH